MNIFVEFIKFIIIGIIVTLIFSKLRSYIVKNSINLLKKKLKGEEDK